MEVTQESNESQPTTWPQVAEASARQPSREMVTEVIDVKLTETDLADIARANASDDQDKTELQEDLDALREDIKAKKTAIGAIEARVRDRNNAVRAGVQSRNAEWIVEEIFDTNTVRYLDPRTERVVFERPMKFEERQTELPLTGATNATPAAADEAPALEGADAAAVTDPSMLLDAAQRGDAANDDEIDADDLDGGESADDEEEHDA